MNRRSFFNRLTSGLFAASAPALFLPKLIKPAWKTFPNYGLIPAATKNPIIEIFNTWDYLIRNQSEDQSSWVLIDGNQVAQVMAGEYILLPNVTGKLSIQNSRGQPPSNISVTTKNDGCEWPPCFSW